MRFSSPFKKIHSLIEAAVTTALETVSFTRGEKSLRGSSLYRNAGYLLLNSALNSVFGLVFWLIVARVYPSRDVGIASALIAATMLLNSVSFFGFNIGLIRFLPDREDKAGIINSCFTVVSMSAAAGAVVFILGTSLWSPGLLFLREDPKLFLIFFLSATATSLLMIQGQAFVALRFARFMLVQQVIVQALRVGLVFAVPHSILWVFSSWGLAAVVGLLAGNFFLKKAQPGYSARAMLDRQFVSKVLRYSLGNYVGEVMGSAPIYVLPLIILNTLGPEPSAFFRIGYGLAAPLMAIPTAIILSLFAEGSAEPGKLRANLLRAANLILVLLLPAIVLITLFADKVLLIFGYEYSQNALELSRILGVSAIALTVVELYVVSKRVLLQLRPIIYIYFLEVVLIIALSTALAKGFGIAGVGIGWVLGYGITAVVAGILLTRLLRALKTDRATPFPKPEP